MPVARVGRRIRHCSPPAETATGAEGWDATQAAPEDVDATAKRELITDTELNIYREILELDDGTRLEVTARLTDHQDPAAGDQVRGIVTDPPR